MPGAPTVTGEEETGETFGDQGGFKQMRRNIDVDCSFLNNFAVGPDNLRCFYDGRGELAS